MTAEQIQPLLRPSDYLAAIVVPRANYKEIYRQAIITLETGELVDFMLLAKKGIGATFEFSGDMFFQALAECVGKKGEVGFVTEQKIADLCVVLAQRNFDPIVISHIVQIMSGRLERTAIRDIVARTGDDVRDQLLTLIHPSENQQTLDLELNLKRLYQEREKEARVLRYDLRNTNHDTPPDRIRIFNTFIGMQPQELVAIDRLASRHGGSIFKMAVSIQRREELAEVQAFLRGKKDPSYAQAEKYLISLCQ
jgi:hypothetical protein